ncbi:MAG: hypothetical protein AAF492_23455, partial [Verrucomicrobiota bacterium]
MKICLAGLMLVLSLDVSHAASWHEAYIWQRNWSDEVMAAMERSSHRFHRFVLLGGEVDWVEGQPALTRVQPPWPRVKKIVSSVGLALRIRNFSGEVEEPAATEFLLETARTMIDEVRAAGLQVAEFQIDYDCPESRLEQYEDW